VSPDGRNVYVASFGSNAVAVFARDKKTGVLAQLAGTDACVSRVFGANCVDGEALEDASDVAVSADGSAGACADGEGLLEFGGRVAVSPDGRNVYVASSTSGNVAVAVFAHQKK
jgi:DNA-binding beta-propeller fold protein YncE